jgi:hypothetical protein
MRIHLHRWLPTVIALVALVVALGGTSSAANKISGKSILKGTVASKQLKDLGVLGADLRGDAVTGEKVADGSLTSADLGDGSVTSQDVTDGSLTGVDVKDASLGAADLAASSVGTSELADSVVTGRALDGAGFAPLDFPSIAAGSCTLSTFAPPGAEIADGNLSDDVVLATPDAFFGGNFSFSVKTEGGATIGIKMCNVSAAAADPDGGGGTKLWRWVAIDLG